MRNIQTYVWGGDGKMATLVKQQIHMTPGFELSESEVDLVIDFSHPSCLEAVLAFAVSKKAHVLIATTGHSPEDEAILKEASQKIPILVAPNTSLGVFIVNRLLHHMGTLTQGLYQAEILDIHHNQKVDAPSGTAKQMARTLGQASGVDTIPVHAMRIGGVFGEHKVIFASEFDTIEITHRAHSRQLFAQGALTMGQLFLQKQIGLYTVEDIYA